jgi:hypothetical protein
MSNQPINSGERSKNQPSHDAALWLELVREQVTSLKFGTVQITVHDSRVTQVERLEKVRLDQPKHT